MILDTMQLEGTNDSDNDEGFIISVCMLWFVSTFVILVLPFLVLYLYWDGFMTSSDSQSLVTIGMISRTESTVESEREEDRFADVEKGVNAIAATFFTTKERSKG